MTQVSLSELSIQQLNQLSMQIDEEFEFLKNSQAQLKIVQQKFVESGECLTRIGSHKDKDIMVPLTSSMYVAGKLSDVEHVLIDVGTGYYLEQSIDAAKLYFERKVDYLTKQMEKIQPKLQDKFNMKRAVMEVMQLKVQAAQLGTPQQTTTTGQLCST